MATNCSISVSQMSLLFYVFLHAWWCDVRVSMWVYVHLQVCVSLYMRKPEVKAVSFSISLHLFSFLSFFWDLSLASVEFTKWLPGQNTWVSLKGSPVSTFPALGLLLYIVLLFTRVLGLSLCRHTSILQVLDGLDKLPRPLPWYSKVCVAA